jgi:deoxyadenosine/deoxycytidine kinase
MDQREQDIADTLYDYLKEKYKVYSIGIEGVNDFKTIIINGKSKNLWNSKKDLVNLLYNDLPKSFTKLDTVIVRQTIKKG